MVINLTTKNNIISYVSTDGLIITVFKNESPLSINTLEVIVNGRNKTTDTLIFEIYNENIIGIIERDSIISILLNKKGKIDSIKIKKK